MRALLAATDAVPRCRQVESKWFSLVNTLDLPRMHVVGSVLLGLLVAIELVAADELDETSVAVQAQDAASSEFEAKVAVAIRQSQAEEWLGPRTWSSGIECLLQFCASDPAPAFCSNSSACTDTIRADYKDFYNAEVLAFDFPVCAPGWPCWDSSYSAGECWPRSFDPNSHWAARICVLKGVSCIYRDADGSELELEPGDVPVPGGDYHPWISVDISDFPPAATRPTIIPCRLICHFAALW